MWSVLRWKVSSWWLGCNYKSEPLVPCSSQDHHGTPMGSTLVAIWQAVQMGIARELMPMGLLLIKGGWEPTNEFPNLHPLVDICRMHSLYFSEIPANWSPVANSSNLDNASFYRLFLPSHPLSLPPCSSFCVYFSDKPPSPSVLILDSACWAKQMQTAPTEKSVFFPSAQMLMNPFPMPLSQI